jgi:alpha/beta superfamily hydrolase
MNPFYFGDSKNPLFGVFHAPQSEAGMDMAIVICPPVVHEYIRTHRALRQLAMALSANGFPVMRFDYFGVGDSAGESGEGGTERWALDIKSAIDEGMSHSNKRNVCLIGLRLGAALALKAVSTATSCTALI